MSSKTVKVRIPVAVYPDGRWDIRRSGSFESEEELMNELQYASLPWKREIQWHEFEVPIPKPVEVEGRVSE